MPSRHVADGYRQNSPQVPAAAGKTICARIPSNLPPTGTAEITAPMIGAKHTLHDRAGMMMLGASSCSMEAVRPCKARLIAFGRSIICL